MFARRDGHMRELAVHDDGTGVDEAVLAPQGRGLENTRERLRSLYGQRATLVVERGRAGGTMATLRIPWRELVLEREHDRS